MNHVDLEKLVLKSGGHAAGSEEFCVMEAVAYFAHEPHSDRPKCASRAITSFLQTWNDSMNDEDRQKLKKYIPLVVGTATNSKDEERRGWLATDWLVRSFAPVWLDLAGLTSHASALRALPELSTPALAREAQTVIDAARSAADSAADSAAYSAARSAARSAADSAAYSAARSAARSAAYSAAYSAADSAADSAAYSAAAKALEPAVRICQESAFGLLDRMIAVGKTPIQAAA